MPMFNIKPVNIEDVLNIADFDAKNNPARYTQEKLFNLIR